VPVGALLAEDPAARTGLGLSIVRAVALGAGLDLRLQSPAPGRPDGVEAEVALIPAARSPLPG
jgi:two-component system OmpR family sensor kinase